MSFAVAQRTLLTSRADRSGFAARTKAALAVTTGAAMDVPSMAA
jgi:hypothetical protein